MTLALWLCGAYLIGAIPTGVILTRIVGGKDIRTSGSGNIGATNVYRVAGKKLGIITLLGDCLKGFVPVMAAQQMTDFATPAVAAVALAAFLGHCYPVYLGFKGGKGVATALGIFLVLSPLSVLLTLIVFITVLWKWRFISLASISAAAFIPIFVFLLTRSLPVFTVTLIIAVIVIWRHKTNIERLRQGNENRFKL